MSAASSKRRYATPEGKFVQQRRQAKQRNIDWLLEFEEWMSIWLDSGHWEHRGKRMGQYVMARKGDVGPYSRDNVYICLASENHSHAHSNGRIVRRPPRRPQTTKRVIRGWTFVHGKYQVMFAKKYIGRFCTQEEAEAAHANARERHQAERNCVNDVLPGSDVGFVHASNSLAPL